MEVRKIIGHKIICDRRSCHPRHEGCHSEIYFDDSEVIWEYENLQDKSIRLRDVFDSLDKVDNLYKMDSEAYSVREFGYLVCPVCGEKLYYGSREFYLPLIKNVITKDINGMNEEELADLEQAVDYYKNNLFTSLKELLEREDVKRGTKEVSAFVSYFYGEPEKVS